MKKGTRLSFGALAALATIFCFSTNVQAANKQTLVPRRLDGVLVPKSQSNLRPIAVMIDNHTAARPQSSLSKASVVYETLAEGGIPRFMAVYADPNVGIVGPIRSTRPYFVNYATEYSAPLAHAGGSPDGIAALKKHQLMNLEGIKGPYAKLFFRTYGGGVHGLYANMSALRAAVSKTSAGKVAPNYAGYKFSAGVSLAKRGKDKSGVNIDLGYGISYDAKYVYDRKNNRYVRYTGGRVLMDRQTKSAVTVKNVVILLTGKAKVLDKKGRLDIPTIGSGKAILLQNGKAITIKWSKKSARDRTIFTTMTGAKVTFVTGSLWITVVPQGHKVKVF